jgi:hypothetical protein
MRNLAKDAEGRGKPARQYLDHENPGISKVQIIDLKDSAIHAICTKSTSEHVGHRCFVAFDFESQKMYGL